MEILYLACLMTSIGMLFWLKIFDVRNSSTQLINLLIILVTNLGYYFEIISTTLEEAVLAHKIAYVGAVFMPLFYLLLVLEICHINIRRELTIFLMSVQFVIFGFVCTIGSSDLFYKNVGIDFYNGNTLITKSYGPVHGVQVVIMGTYLLASFMVVVYSLIKDKTLNKRGAIAMIVLSLVAVGIYTYEKIAGLVYEYMPIAFVLLMIGVLIPVYKSNLYTVYQKQDIINETLGNYGFLTFDKKLIYQSCNTYMSNVFPELSNYRVGQKIEGCSEALQNLINQVNLHDVHKHKHSDGEHHHHHRELEAFWLNDKCYEAMIHEVTNSFGVLKGYTIEIKDDTADRMVIKLKENYNEELSKEVDEKTERIRYIQQKTILGMAQMVESRDLSTGGHIKRTSDVVKIFSEKLLSSDLGFDEHFLNLVIRSAPMHDLGKIGVDDAILRKQGRFTDEEYDKMKKHSEIGFHMVSEILEGVEEPEFVSVAENVAHYHHEKVNGAGYPNGLKGDSIPVEARIMALADVFDALVSKRCYKDAFSYDRAFDIISNDAGTHFDADLARVFISCRSELEDYYNKSEE